MAFTEQVLQKVKAEQRKIILVCGWWYNELRVRSWNCEQNKNVFLVFYIDRVAMEKYIAAGYEIFFLPEQDMYNNQYSQMHYTGLVSKPYM